LLGIKKALLKLSFVVWNTPTSIKVETKTSILAKPVERNLGDRPAGRITTNRNTAQTLAL
jgi:hypothetical protein